MICPDFEHRALQGNVTSTDEGEEGEEDEEGSINVKPDDETSATVPGPSNSSYSSRCATSHV